LISSIATRTPDASSPRYAALCAALALACSLFSADVKAQSNPPPASSAATPEAYDTLLDEAVSAFDASDFARARKLFEQAFDLRPNSRVLRGMGIAALRLERYSEAYRTLTASLKHPAQPLTASQKEEVTGLLSWMETTLACIKLRWTPAEPARYEVLLDGKVLQDSALWVSAGTHHVAVHAPGFGAVERTLTLAPEQHEVIELTLSKREPPPVTVAAKPAVMPSDAAHSLRGQEPVSHAALVPQTSPQSGTPRDADDGSVLTRWWFWTAVAAVAAGGVVTAVLLSTPAPRSSPDLSDGARLVTIRK
jgi:hypothetical protein